MKRYIVTAVVCVCLLIGSLYPQMILRRHLQLKDGRGAVTEETEEIDPELPLKVRFRFLEMLKAL